MAISSYPPIYPVKKIETLTSGSSWTVPSGVLQVIATLIGAGGGGGYCGNLGTYSMSQPGLGGQIRSTTLTTTPGASISYSIGAGGAGGTSGSTTGGTGGTTTLTGATSALGGNGGSDNTLVSAGSAGTDGLAAFNNGGAATASSTSTSNGGDGGDGMIVLEYYV